MDLSVFTDWDDECVTVVTEADHDEPGGPTRLAVLGYRRDGVQIIEASGSQVLGNVIINDGDEVARLIDALEEYASDA